MIRFILSVVMSLCFGICHSQIDPVIMRINGHDITRAEFEYSYNKNNTEGVIDKKDVNDYIQLFIDYKLKVEAAKDAGIDTLENIKTEIQGYREMMVYPTIENPVYVEREAYKTYLQSLEYYGHDDIIDCHHIIVPMAQDATEADQRKAKALIDSIYSRILAGEDFVELARKLKQDNGTIATGAKLPKFGRGHMIPEFEEQVYKMSAGQISEPFKTVAGWHLVRVNGRAPFESFQFHHDNIVKFLFDKKGFREAAAEALIDSLAQQQGVDKEVVFQQLFDDMIARDPDNRYLSQEYYDGTLMYEISKTLVWDKAKSDKAGLEAYFNENKEKYAWTEPHFRGMVIHAKDKKAFKAAKKAVKGLPLSEWMEAANAVKNEADERVVKAERPGVYKPGDSQSLDKLVFKTRPDEFKVEGFPVVGAIGKKLKKPQTYEDVLGQVTADFQKEREDEWVRSLRAKYPVEIFQDVVQTVNNH